MLVAHMGAIIVLLKKEVTKKAIIVWKKLLKMMNALIFVYGQQQMCICYWHIHCKQTTKWLMKIVWKDWHELQRNDKLIKKAF